MVSLPSTEERNVAVDASSDDEEDTDVEEE